MYTHPLLSGARYAIIGSTIREAMPRNKQESVIAVNIRKIISGLLAAALLTASLTACADVQEPDDATGTDAGSETEAGGLVDNLPDDLDFKNDEVNIISRYREGWTAGEISVEALNSDPVNDAVYERNRVVENRLHIRINSIENHDNSDQTVTQLVSRAVHSNTGEYDICATVCYWDMSEALKGTFANLRAVDYLDFGQPWWSQGFNEVIEYKDTQYAVTGSIGLSLYRFTFATLFNKAMFDKAGVPYVYEAVRSGTWTLDYQASLVPLFHVDDGNGKQDQKSDVFGFVSCSGLSTDPYWSSCQLSILEKDDNGEYAAVMDTDRTSEAVDKILHLFYETDGASLILPEVSYNYEQDDIRSIFSEGRAAMATMRLMELEIADMRDMSDAYGVAPIPKLDAAQTGYRTFMHDQFTVFSVLTTVTGDRLDEMGAVLECMGVEGERTIKPAYYETALRYKYMKDPESWDMMNILVDNIYIDAGIIFISELNSYHHSLRDQIIAKRNNVASTFKNKNRQLEKAVGNINKKLNKLAGE